MLTVPIIKILQTVYTRSYISGEKIINWLKFIARIRIYKNLGYLSFGQSTYFFTFSKINKCITFCGDRWGYQCAMNTHALVDINYPWREPSLSFCETNYNHRDLFSMSRERLTAFSCYWIYRFPLCRPCKIISWIFHTVRTNYYN